METDQTNTRAKIEQLMRKALIRRIKARSVGLYCMCDFEGQLIRDLHAKWLAL